MRYENVDLHHVSEIKKMPDGGIQLLRVPEKVLHQMNDGARRTGLESIGSEVRFVVDGPAGIYVTVGGLNGETDVMVYRGTFQHSIHRLHGLGPKLLALDAAPRLDGIRPEVRKSFAFSPDVWRIVFNRQIGVFYGIESFGYPIRPPTVDEVPKKRWLAYGSSITHSNAVSGYPFHAAARMGVDLLNYGFSGSCHCEPAMADHIATRGGWDFCTMELGINMRGSFTPEEFRKRAEYLIRTVVEKNPDKPVAIITHFPTDMTFATRLVDYGERELKFEESLRDIVTHLKHRKCRVIDGGDVLDRYDLHGVDLIHPSHVGHAIMGQNLANILTEWMDSL